MNETSEDPVYENHSITPGKNKEARSSQEEDVTYSQVKIRTAPKAEEARSSQEEDVTYSQVNISTAQRSPKAADTAQTVTEEQYKSKNRKRITTKKFTITTSSFEAEAGSLQEDDLTYSEVLKGSKPQKAPEQRSKCTKRVVLLVATAVFVLAVIAIIISIITTCSENPPQCDGDWELHGEKCYFFSPITPKLSWMNSKSICQWLKGNLVKINSREEQDFLDVKVRSLMNDDEDRFWIGLTDSETEGEWLWTDGSRLNTSLTFWKTAPDNYTEGGLDEDCAIMGERKNMNGVRSWFDVFCTKNYRIICEKPASRPKTCN